MWNNVGQQHWSASKKCYLLTYSISGCQKVRWEYTTVVRATQWNPPHCQIAPHRGTTCHDDGYTSLYSLSVIFFILNYGRLWPISATCWSTFRLTPLVIKYYGLEHHLGELLVLQTDLYRKTDDSMTWKDTVLFFRDFSMSSKHKGHRRNLSAIRGVP